MGSFLIHPSTLAHDARGLCKVARACGGCPQIETDPALMRQQRLASIEQLLAAAGCSALRLDAYLESSPVSYRNRIRLRVFEDGRFGFFNGEKSTSCVVLDAQLRRLLEQLMARLSGSPHVLKGYAHFELRVPDMNENAGLLLTRSSAASGDPRSLQGSLLSETSDTDRPLGTALELTQLLLGLPLLIGESHWAKMPRQKFLLPEAVFQWVPLDGFMQVNSFINHALIRWLLKQARMHSVSSVADLYAGAGNFLLPLLAQGYQGVGVECHKSSVLCAQQSLVEQGLSGEFVHSDVALWLRNNQRHFSLTVVDAPRAGLRELADAVGRLGSDHIALISCNPRSLVRDLVRLVSLGYVVESLRVFDMFAYTDHVELGVWLSRVG